MKIKLYWKLTFVFCFVVVLAITSGYLYLVPRLKSYVENNLANNIKRQLFLSKDFLESSQKDMPGQTDLQSAAGKIGSILGLRVTIISPDGKVLGDSELTREGLLAVENHSDRPEVKDALSRGLGMSKRFSSTVKKEMLYMAVPLNSGMSRGVLRFSESLQDIDLLEAKINKVVGLGVIGILLFGLGLTAFVSVFVSRPLAEMSLVARGMARGDFSRKAYSHSRDEIGDLAQALNAMSEEIKDKIGNLNSESAKLDLVLSSMFEGVIVTDADEKIFLCKSITCFSSTYILCTSTTC